MAILCSENVEITDERPRTHQESDWDILWAKYPDGPEPEKERVVSKWPAPWTVDNPTIVTDGAELEFQCRKKLHQRVGEFRLERACLDDAVKKGAIVGITVINLRERLL